MDGFIRMLFCVPEACYSFIPMLFCVPEACYSFIGMVFCVSEACYSLFGYQTGFRRGHGFFIGSFDHFVGGTSHFVKEKGLLHPSIHPSPTEQLSFLIFFLVIFSNGFFSDVSSVPFILVSTQSKEPNIDKSTISPLNHLQVFFASSCSASSFWHHFFNIN